MYVVVEVLYERLSPLERQETLKVLLADMSMEEAGTAIAAGMTAARKLALSNGGADAPKTRRPRRPRQAPVLPVATAPEPESNPFVTE
jgi:hypothetical protein